MVDCPECGAQNPDSSTYCGLCSSSFAPSGAPPAAAPEMRELDISGLGAGYKDAMTRRKRRGLVWVVALSVVLVLVVLGVVLFGNRASNEPDAMAQYTGKTSGLSFAYPSSWEKKDREYLETLTGNPDLDQYEGNEIILMKRGQAVYRHMLIATSMPSQLNNQPWSDAEGALKQGFAESAHQQGYDLAFLNLNIPKESGNGFAMELTISPEYGPRLYELQAYIVKGSVAYLLLLTTPLEGGGGDEGEARRVFYSLIDSVRIQ